MGRTSQRNAVRKKVTFVDRQSKGHVMETGGKLKVPLTGRSRPRRVELPDVCSPRTECSEHSKKKTPLNRSVLGDKTNKSPIISSNEKIPTENDGSILELQRSGSAQKAASTRKGRQKKVDSPHSEYNSNLEKGERTPLTRSSVLGNKTNASPVTCDKKANTNTTPKSGCSSKLEKRRESHLTTRSVRDDKTNKSPVTSCSKKEATNALSPDYESTSNLEKTQESPLTRSVPSNKSNKSTVTSCSKKVVRGTNIHSPQSVYSDSSEKKNEVPLTRRSVLGDKTNKSPIITSSSKKISGQNNKSLETGDHSAKFNYITSADSNTCVYSKIERESCITRNMPLEDKLALYEFEVDENEPTVKKKKTTRKRKRKIRTDSSDEDFCKLSKTAKKLESKKNCIVKRSRAPKNIQTSHLPHVLPIISKSLSQTNTVTSELVLNSHSEIDEISSPVPEQDLPTFPKLLLQNDTLGNETMLNPSSEISKISSRVQSKGGHRRRLSERLLEEIKEITASDEKDSPNRGTSSKVSNALGNRSCHLLVGAKFGHDKEVVVVEDNEADVSVLSPVAPRQQMRESTSSNLAAGRSSLVNSTPDSTVRSSLPSFRKVFFGSHMKDGVSNADGNETTEEWSVDNCFGFEEDTANDVTCSSAQKSTLPSCSTPILSIQKPKPLPTRAPVTERVYVYDLTVKKPLFPQITKLIAETPKVEARAKCQSPDSSKPDANVATSNVGSPTLACTAPSAYSSSLKQTTLDFTATASKVTTTITKTPIANLEKPKVETPVLFQEIDDTPTCFKEPPRRSYHRTRTPNRRLGGDYVVLDDDDDEDENKKNHSTKKPKRDKMSKKEQIEANKWMKEFNYKCGEIEEFELVFE